MEILMSYSVYSRWLRNLIKNYLFNADYMQDIISGTKNTITKKPTKISASLHSIYCISSYFF